MGGEIRLDIQHNGVRHGEPVSCASSEQSWGGELGLVSKGVWLLRTGYT